MDEHAAGAGQRGRLVEDAVSGAVTRDQCGGCGSARLELFLDLGSTPPADRFPLPDEDDLPAVPLRALVCRDCWLAQLAHVIPAAELFGDDYGFMTGASPALAAYFRGWATWAMEQYPAQAADGVTEIACNDGTLLAEFAAAGHPALGVEPAGPPALAARERGLKVLREPFTAAAASAMPKAGMVIACNVIAHVDDPRDFLAGIRELLKPGGVAIVEFQYLGDLLTGCMIDHVYHEHRFFYSLSSFAALAWQAGLRITRVLSTPNQGGSLRVVLDGATPALLWTPPMPMEAAMTGMGAYSSMQGRADHLARSLVRLVDAEIADGRTVAGYGASAKSATLLGFAGIGRSRLTWMEDLTPGKIGRETPGTRIPILGPSQLRADTYLLTAWNYLGAIVRRESDFLAAGGKLIVPAPVPVII